MTNLSRRRFFGLLGGAAATYFLPPIGGWKSEWQSDWIVNPCMGYDVAIVGGDITAVTILNAGSGYLTVQKVVFIPKIWDKPIPVVAPWTS